MVSIVIFLFGLDIVLKKYSLLWIMAKCVSNGKLLAELMAHFAYVI